MVNFTIADRIVSNSSATFVVAELSANHNQDFEIAVKSVIAAKEAGADAVKLQTYTADILTLDSDNEYFQIKQGTIWDGNTLYRLYQDAYTPWEWHSKLQKVAEDHGLVFFSTPFDRSSADFLEVLNVPVYKIASFEIVDIPLIRHVASKGKPVIISTGIASLVEIGEAVAACLEVSKAGVALLKCTSSYPALYEDMNLHTIRNMSETFGVISGLSDHTLGVSIPIAAVALGARIIEKHFILDRTIGGPDASFSLEPKEFRQMTEGVRQVEKALGLVTYSVTPAVEKSRKFARSLFVARDMNKGDIFTTENVRSIRPGDGLPPKFIEIVLGRRANMTISKGTPLTWEMIE